MSIWNSGIRSSANRDFERTSHPIVFRIQNLSLVGERFFNSMPLYEVVLPLRDQTDALLKLSSSMSVRSRETLLRATDTNAYRLVHGAGDGLDGFYLDRFGDYLLASKAGKPSASEKERCAFWMETCQSRGVYLKQLQKQVRKIGVASASPVPWLGQSDEVHTVIRERSLRYRIRFDEGYSVGIFLDQRENRGRWTDGKVAPGFAFDLSRLPSGEVLNTFAYTCAFSVCIGRGGYRAVSLDLSRKYLDWGREHFELNQMDPEDHDFIYGDAFDWMRRFRNRGRRFSGIILDPPTFSKAPKTKKMFQAERDYPELLGMSLALIEPGGVILACNNTAHWHPRAFERMVRDTLKERGAEIQRIHAAPQAVDFPVSAGSPQYLKSIWIQVGKTKR